MSKRGKALGCFQAWRSLRPDSRAFHKNLGVVVVKDGGDASHFFPLSHSTPFLYDEDVIYPGSPWVRGSWFTWYLKRGGRDWLRNEVNVRVSEALYPIQGSPTYALSIAKSIKMAGISVVPHTRFVWNIQ